jgi:tyrosinase
MLRVVFPALCFCCLVVLILLGHCNAPANSAEQIKKARPKMLRIRKNVLTLTAREKSDFVQAVLELKERGIYDRLVKIHVDAVLHATPGENETPSSVVRNAAHRGPAFPPWHRAYLNLFEDELQKINPAVTIPYWDWTMDAELPDPAKSPIWSADFMGGNGVKEKDWEVGDGPFAFKNGRWPITVPGTFDGQVIPPYLRRGFGQFTDPLGVVVRTLPTREDVMATLKEPLYDMAPWDARPFTGGFRNRLEGWVTEVADALNVKHRGVQLHNRTHIFIGGTMKYAWSPNDPVFFLHHAYVDRLWVLWENHQRQTNKALAPNEILYLPRTGGPTGHNLYDPMYPFDPPIRAIDVLDHHRLGYRYDNEDAPKTVPTLPECHG